ncbi:RimK family alpha-L-glutamate ligase [Mycobacterium adipatum]|uniref:ATP-grasp domain-containing protein n=1 Tax=Mycobacterium adipatum TaxID=1682113 RepID=UPI0034E066CF
MKLARPEVFHPRIVLASCAALPEGDSDDAGLVAALRARGLHVSWKPWDDPVTLQADLVVLRATWDYSERVEEFVAWTRAVRNLLNPPALVAWNIDKHYLLDLQRDGLPIVPTRYYGADETVPPPTGEVVVKPAVGAGSVGAQRFVDPAAALRHAGALQSAGRAVLVQPYDPRIARGETALVFLNGEPSHAFTKGPILPPAGRGPQFEPTGTFAAEKLGAADPAEEVWEVGHAAIAAVTNRFAIASRDLLYARVDVIGGADDPRLLELELVEPSLGFRQLGAAEKRRAERDYALGVEAALIRLGLGPLSHRGM